MCCIFHVVYGKIKNICTDFAIFETLSLGQVQEQLSSMMTNYWNKKKRTYGKKMLEQIKAEWKHYQKKDG